MTPNVARLLRKYGVDKAIGADLVKFSDLHLRRWETGVRVGHAPLGRVEQTLKQPWWLVHRHHLHSGLVKVAKQSGCDIIIGSRVAEIQYKDTPQNRVTVKTEQGREYTFDLLVGADGVTSIVRRTILPGVKPLPPNGNCAYRAIVPMEKLLQDPELREIDPTNMNVWMGSNALVICDCISSDDKLTLPHRYIITYPISDKKDFNMVLSHHVGKPTSVVEEVDMSVVKEQYRGWDPRITKIIDMIPEVKRWPLMVTGPLKTWSNSQKNIVLMGDSAHSMQNHMAQGAATSMEDGAFLATCLREVMSGSLTIDQAIGIYEKGRMPKAHVKQQVSYMNGMIWMLQDGPEQESRDAVLAPELKGEQPIRSPNAYSDPGMILELYGYDAEAHAEEEIAKVHNQNVQPRDKRTGLTVERADMYVNWFLPEANKFRIKSRL